MVNNTEKKKRSFQEYFQSSVIVAFLLRISDAVYNKLSGGFYGRAATAYDAENRAAQNSALYRLSKKSGYGQKVARPVKQAIARTFEQSFILGKISYFLDTLLYCAMKVHGVFFVSFGLYTEIVFFIKAALSGTIKDADYTQVLIGAVLMIMSLPLIFSNQTPAKALCENRITSLLLFDVIGANREAFTKDIRRRDHLYTPFIIGMVFGLATSVFSPLHIILAILGILGMYTVLVIPESGVLLLAALAPFAPTMALAGLTLFTFMCFILKLIRGKRSIKFSLADFMITAFTVMTLLGGFISPDRSESIKPALIYTVFLLAYFLCANLIRTKEWLDRCIYAMIISLFAVSLYGVLQYALGMSATTWQDVSMFSDIEGRVVSTFENPNVLAEYLVMTIPLAFALAVTSHKRSGRAGALVTLAVSVLCLVFTWSRGAWLGFLLGAFILLLMYSRKVFALMAGALVFVPFLPFILPSSVINRFASIGNLADTSTSYRVNIWNGVTRMLGDYWFSGIGTGYPAFSKIYPAYSLTGIESAPHSHNLFFQIITEHGVFTLILFLLIILLYMQGVFTFRKYESADKKYVAAAFMCGIVAVLVQGLTDYIWYNYRVYLIFWLIIGLTTATRRCCRITRM